MVKAKKAPARHASRITRHDSATTEVVTQLQSYASRGVFREFTVKQARHVSEFRFVWLSPRAIRAKYDGKSGIFTLIDLLPDISPKSRMDVALRTFLKSRFSRVLPAHRRLSKSLVKKLVCVNRRRTVSLRLTLSKKSAGEGAKQAIHLVSELFQNFLAGPYHEYMVKNFDLRED